MAEQQERLGQRVGEYRLHRLLGRGSFGAVYLAEHLYDHSQAAVKLLRLQLTSRKDLKDFLNEARTMMHLHHPHIVPLLDFGLTHDDIPYLTMEYAGKGTLRQCHPKGTKLPLETVDVYVTQLASALQYAHDRRIVHRDVKPDNILLRTDGTILLSDFGIAKVLEQSSLVSLQAQAAGTPAYMSPEQSQGKPCPASDQYALAVIVYEWLAGRLPFQGAPLEVMLQHRVDEPPALQEVCPEVPVGMELVVMQALAKTPEGRFSTIQQFAEALHTALRVPSSTDLMTQQSEKTSYIPSAIVSSQPSGQPTAFAESWVTNDQKVILVPPSVSSLQTVWPIDTGVPAEPDTSSPRLPKTFSAPAVMSHSRNKRFARPTFLVTLLCLALSVGLVGGGTWTIFAQQHSLDSQHVTATVKTTLFVTAAAQANILLSDPLNRNTRGWNTDPPNVYAFKDGAYHITDDNDQNGRASILSTNSFDGIIAYQLTMQQITGDDTNANNSFGMIFRFSEQSNKKNINGKPIITFYSFEVVNIKGGVYNFWKYDNTNPDNPWTQIQDGKLPFGDEFHQGQSSQATNTFKIFMNRDRFTVTVNGKKLPRTFYDDSLSQGKVGMIVNLKGTEVAFSNLLLTRS